MEDVPALVAAASIDRSTYQWTLVPDGEPAMRQYVEAALDLASRGEAIPFATTWRETGEVIGSTRFANFEYHVWPAGNPLAREDGRPDGVEIGWTWISAPYQRGPTNTEAKYLMLQHAFEHWQVRVLRLKTDRRNERSRAAIERIGAKLDGIVRGHQPAYDGAFRDTAFFSMLDSEWSAARDALRERMNRK